MKSLSQIKKQIQIRNSNFNRAFYAAIASVFMYLFRYGAYDKAGKAQEVNLGLNVVVFLILFGSIAIVADYRNKFPIRFTAVIATISLTVFICISLFLCIDMFKFL